MTLFSRLCYGYTQLSKAYTWTLIEISAFLVDPKTIKRIEVYDLENVHSRILFETSLWEIHWNAFVQFMFSPFPYNNNDRAIRHVFRITRDTMNPDVLFHMFSFDDEVESHSPNTSRPSSLYEIHYADDHLKLIAHDKHTDSIRVKHTHTKAPQRKYMGFMIGLQNVTRLANIYTNFANMTVCDLYKRFFLQHSMNHFVNLDLSRQLLTQGKTATVIDAYDLDVEEKELKERDLI